MSDAAPLSPRIQFVDANGYLTRDAILLLQQLQSGVTGGVFQPSSTILTGISNMGTGTGLVAQTAAASFLKRTLVGSSPILIADGNGVAGNPTFTGDIASDAEAIAGTDTTKIITPANLAAVIAAGGAAITSPFVTYTPTFTGFGVPTNISFWSCRHGDSLLIRGRFTSGAPTGVEARITLGFNGVNGGITSDATKVPAIGACGYWAPGHNAAASVSPLIESNSGYMTFGVQAAGSFAMTKALGNAMIVNATTVSMVADIPISGW